MRIGITCYPTYGGSGAVATELGLDLARRGHEVHFISYASPFRLRGFAERVTFHEVVTADYPLFEHSDAVTAVSTYLRDETYRAFGCVDCDVRVIPNFVSQAEYHPPRDGSCRGSLAPAAHKILIHVSNFRPVKRVRDVVAIFAAVRKAIPATLILVGDGPDRDAVEQESDRRGLGSDVRFFGKVDQVGDLLRGSDLFLLPSETESFGLAALEAMACGVPVVASAVGGLPEVVG